MRTPLWHSQRSFVKWRSPVGILTGVALTTVLYGTVYLFTRYAGTISGSLSETTETVLFIVG